MDIDLRLFRYLVYYRRDCWNGRNTESEYLNIEYQRLKESLKESSEPDDHHIWGHSQPSQSGKLSLGYIKGGFDNTISTSTSPTIAKRYTKRTRQTSQVGRPPVHPMPEQTYTVDELQQPQIDMIPQTIGNSFVSLNQVQTLEDQQDVSFDLDLEEDGRKLGTKPQDADGYEVPHKSPQNRLSGYFGDNKWYCYCDRVAHCEAVVRPGPNHNKKCITPYVYLSNRF